MWSAPVAALAFADRYQIPLSDRQRQHVLSDRLPDPTDPAFARDLVSVIGQLRRSVAGELQHFEAPRSWVGTEGVNIFNLLLQLMKVVEQLAASAANHDHGGPPPVPPYANAFNTQSKQAGQLATTLSPIIE